MMDTASSVSLDTRKLQEVLDHSRDVMYRMRLDTLDLEYISPACTAISGFTPEEARAMGYERLRDRVHPDDRARVPLAVGVVESPNERDGTPVTVDFRFLHRDGQYRCFSVARELLRDASGRPVLAIGTVTDVTARRAIEDELSGYRQRLTELVDQRTQELARVNERLQAELAERQRAEESLRESEDRFRQIAENIRELFWLTDARTGKLLYASPAVEQVYGYPLAEFYARTERWLECVHPEDRARVLADVQRQQAGEATEHEYRAMRADGTLRWLRARAFPIRNERGEVVRIAGVSEDITERKRAESFVRRQRDLGIALAGVDNLAAAMNLVLDVAVKIEGVDCGGTYALDQATGAMTLVAHRGVSPAFATAVQRLEPRTAPAESMQEGHPVYIRSGEVWRGAEPLRQEGLRAAAAIPILHEGRMVASLNVGSRCCDELTSSTRAALEALAAKIGAVIARLHAEEARRESDEQFRVLCTTAPIGIFLADVEGSCTYVNPYLAALAGLPETECLGFGWTQIIHPDDLPAVRDEVGRHQVDGQDFAREFRLRRRDGSERWVRVHTTPGGLPRQHARPRVGIVVDITDRRQTEETLRGNESQLRLITDNLPALIAQVGPDGRLRFVNQRYADWFGISRAKLIGMHVREVLGESYPVAEPHVRAALAGRTVSFERVAPRADGPHWLAVTYVPEHDGTGNPNGFYALIHDVTDRRLADDRLRQHREQLAHVARVSTIGELASGLAHELSQPLSAVLYYARGCAARLKQGSWDTGRIEMTLDRIASQAERASDFIRRLKTFVRRAQPCRAPCNINEVVQEALDLAGPLARERRVQIAVELDATLPPVVVDAIQIEQVIMNLMRNGVDALDEAGVTERRLVVTTAPGSGQTVCVSVRDTGPGVAPENTDRVFEPFFTTKPEGTGLGLSISRSIIEAHDGTLRVSAHATGGAIFTITLPVTAGDAHGGG